MTAPAAERVSGLSIVMPAYDEEANVGEAIRKALEAGARFTDDLEVVVVDDGSHDATAARVREAAARDPRVRLERHERNRGYGAALRTALRSARKPWVFMTDSDLQFDLTQIGDLLALRGDRTIVVGWRVDRQDHWMRKLNAWAWARLQRVVFGLRVRDIDCAFKLFPRGAIEEVGPLRSEGAFVSAELLLRAHHAGYEIREVPVRHLPRTAGSPTGGRVGVILRAFREMARLRSELRRHGRR